MTTPTPMQDPGPDTRLVDVRGRTIVVRELKDLQKILITRLARNLKKEDQDANSQIETVGKIMDILDSAVVQQEDRDYLIELTIQGNLELKDLMDFISVFDADQEPEKPRVRRGRPAKRS